jgi:hypothetical protein
VGQIVHCRHGAFRRLKIVRLLITFLVAIVATGMFAQLPSPPPVIHLDANAHTITMEIHCDGDRVASITTYVDGNFVMTTVLPFPSPTGLIVQ